ncbi:unnamed protein product [Microthlaspi erraticum]|uniref:Uncharacterized protein n=1 Tax=Microthlaspi erraticum TaxID=1685480 RepID=A0A6D2ISJ6_9BRAS|nr:unnamed protein product [Microthlaspi erraticum]
MPGQSSKAPSDSIKVVPGRSKQRVESSNPVARGGNPNHRTSKVKCLSPQEAIHLSSGVAVTPISGAPSPKKPARPTPGAPRPVFARPTPEASRPVTARPTPEVPRTVSARPTSEEPRPVSARASPEAPSTVRARSTSEALVQAHPAASAKREIVCGLQAMSLTTLTSTRVRRRNTSHLSQSRTVEPPPSPRALRIRSRVRQQAADATPVVEGTVVEVGDGDRAKDHGSNEICQSASVERFSELRQYLPALHPTWKGRIVDSAMLPEFDCEFWAKPASNIIKKAHKLSKAMPTLLNVELLPTGRILNAVFDRSPRPSDVEVYFFPDEKTTERFKGEHDHLFEAMATRNAMIKANINGAELLIFSSKLLDRISQFFINKQYKTENFLWGFFLHDRDLQALVPGTCHQTDMDLDDGDCVDMDLDTESLTPSLALKMIAESQSNLSTSPVKKSNDLPLPPGFEKIWTPLPLVKLNIQGTSNPDSNLTGSAGLVRNESGQWLFGYIRCHKSLTEVTAGLLAVYHGLKYLWDSGYRRIQLETTSREIIDALTTESVLFHKRKSILGCCKDMVLREWDCDIHHISEEENSCAEWLASRVEGQPQGLVFFEYPPRGLLDLLEKDRLRAR